MTPSVFISYSWEDDTHNEWVKKLAKRLREDGVDVTLDKWATAPGDPLTAFMEQAIRENQFILIICTPHYKSRSDEREGGVGYEGDIMTAEAMTEQNHRKFIPVLRKGTWNEAAPSWLLGKYHINLSADPYSEQNYKDLVSTLLEKRETAPPIGEPMGTISQADNSDSKQLDEIRSQPQESLEQFSKPSPLSPEDAVARLKQYIVDPQYRIQLSDLIDQKVEQVIELTSGEAFTTQNDPNLINESVVIARLRGYEEACSTLLAMAVTGGFWAEEEHYPVWQRALQRLGSRTPSSDQVFWFEELQRYPATLLLYALGFSAVEANRLHFLKHILTTTIRREHQNDMPAVQILSPPYLFLQDERAIRVLEQMYGPHAALSHRIQDTLRPHAERIISDNNRYTLVFDKLEILMALSYAHHQGEYSPDRYQKPHGTFVYRYENTTNPILQEIQESLETMQAGSPFVTSGIFGETAAACGQNLATLKDLILNA